MLGQRRLLVTARNLRSRPIAAFRQTDENAPESGRSALPHTKTLSRLDPDLRRTRLFGPRADACAHEAMVESGADALIVGPPGVLVYRRRLRNA
jgi:hypothetical protein